MASFGGAYAWEFEEDGRDIEVKVSGSFMVNDSDMMIEAALSGSGLVYAFEDFTEQHVASGRLIRVLEDYCKPFSGYSLYYPSRRQMPPALSVFIEALRAIPKRSGYQAA
jgi:DNA-binding transcriptional LysR family regulator